MASKRRYTPISAYPVYSRKFDQLRMESDILNPDPRPNVHTIFWDKNTLKAELIKIISSYKPAMQVKLKDIDFQFQDYQQRQINNGFEKPEKMPDSLQNEKYKIEAALDVFQEEQELLSERIKTFTDAIAKKDDATVLEFGLRCSFKSHGLGANDPNLINQMAIIDGQNVSMCPEGFLIIDDDRSPYNKMAVHDYRKLAKQWVSDRWKADAELLKRMQKEARENGEEIPRITGRSMNCQISKKDLPPFPKEYTNHKAVKVEEIEYKRKPKYYADSKK